MARQKGQSLFSYPLTRPYPFVWFTYLVLIGGAICAVLFSFVALAADGYNVDLEYTLDLNGTQHSSYWFQKAPFSWIAKTNVACQPALLTTGSTYFTSNLGFSYTLDRIWRADGHPARKRMLPAAAYLNAPLEDCDVRRIEIDFLRSDSSRSSNFWTWGATTASATVACTIPTSNGSVIQANFTTQLSPIFDLEGSGGPQALVLSTNISDNANMWFGSQLTYQWYKLLKPVMSYSQTPMTADSTETTWDTGVVIFSPNPNVTDYESLAFFEVSATFWSNHGDFVWIHPPNTTADWANSTLNAEYYHLPGITTSVDAFAKNLYSLLLSDFGVSAKSNALTSAAGIKWLGSQVDHKLADLSDGRWSGPAGIQNIFDESDQPYPADKAYDLATEDLGHVPDLNDIKPSTIFAQYLCSIPRRKGPGALFFAVLLADLVFLQTAWQLLNFAATEWVQRKHEDANYCQACFSQGMSRAESKTFLNEGGYVMGQIGSGGSSNVSLPENEGMAGERQRRAQTR